MNITLSRWGLAERSEPERSKVRLTRQGKTVNNVFIFRDSTRPDLALQVRNDFPAIRSHDGFDCGNQCVVRK